MSGTAVTAHIRAMFITYLLQVYAYWLFASTMFIWLASVLYRTTRNTLSTYAPEAAATVVRLPDYPARAPRVHLTPAA